MIIWNKSGYTWFISHIWFSVPTEQLKLGWIWYNCTVRKFILKDLQRHWQRVKHTYYDILQISEETKPQASSESLICDTERLQIVMYDLLAIFDAISVAIFGNGSRDCTEWYSLSVSRLTYSYGLSWSNMGFWVSFTGWRRQIEIWG